MQYSQSSVVSSLLGPKILSILFWNTLNLLILLPSATWRCGLVIGYQRFEQKGNSIFKKDGRFLRNVGNHITQYVVALLHLFKKYIEILMYECFNISDYFWHLITVGERSPWPWRNQWSDWLLTGRKVLNPVHGPLNLLSNWYIPESLQREGKADCTFQSRAKVYDAYIFTLTHGICLNEL
jgi:hypothetical protein